MADAVRRDPERELEAAKADLEQAVMDAYRARKGPLDRERKEELKSEIWRRRIRAIELERDHVGEQLMQARHEADRAAAKITTSTCGSVGGLPGSGSGTSTPSTCSRSSGRTGRTLRRGLWEAADACPRRDAGPCPEP